MGNQTKKVWFITGASKGIGLSLTRQLLQQGHMVAATSRSVAQLQEAVGVSTNQFLALPMNLPNEESVAQALAKTMETFGQIDVVVNNAGYGHLGSLEELSDQEARQNFEVNVFGTLNVIRKALPYLRRQGSGHIFNISSIAGLSGSFPGFGIYCATKFAVNGLTEALAEEVAPFGIKVTLVMPGYIRTNFLTDSSLVTPQAPMPEYANAREMQALHQEQINGNQPGDPEKVVAALIQTAAAENSPLHLLLGSDAYEFANAKLNSLEQEFAQWERVTQSVGFEVEV
ncbi:SDR family NAD(P)-dependent oxidoreductase [Rufibacter immobilis]|uniref:SDR family NAD(P)-dependent oxidoreductase n=1 Tax=Rufibacter immobilis TaxID=1348778 RepID=A0A3M9MXB5_9BACT|nr:oxidoreductase [Rufibacter immobilis]RNI30140.1 SDR family NAD(P)-dependent oxidoreductase [Rufibacter immobilis]